MASDKEDEDYLTMAFEDPQEDAHIVETYSQRRARRLREHDDKTHIKPAKQLEHERREEGLAKNLFAEKSKKESKAMRMMKLMGYTYVISLAMLTLVRARDWDRKDPMDISSRLLLRYLMVFRKLK